uniref:uncharacterized protein LOC120332247 n=1 Tax=Styela clava TaxID=7725 RepID=UPI001939E107|nr:uncharacterized protein LOC120332247 [Styela clava]
MAEQERQPPVINVQLPAIMVHYQEGTRFTGDSVRQKTDVKAEKIRQVVVSTPDTERTSSSSDVTQSLGSMNLSGGMMDFIACENSRHLMQNNEFIEAADQMEDLSPSPYQQLIMSECYFQLGRERNALRCVEALQTMMTSSPKPKVNDVIKLVNVYISDSSHIRALILLSCCAKLYKFDSNSNDSVDGIRECAFKCYSVIKAMAKEGDRMKAIATDVGLGMITDMLTELRSVSGSDKNNRADMEARCLNYVGLSYKGVGKYKKAIEFYNEGVGLLKKTFGSNAGKYNVFGSILSNIGHAHHNLSEYSKAESFYLQSLDGYEKAENWPSDKKKQESIETTTKHLKNTREKIKKC